jgi:hypothetical protein
VFATPVLGGQFAINVLAIYGREQANIDAYLTGALGPIGFATERSVSQALSAFGDVFVQPTLRWEPGRQQLHGLRHGEPAGRRLRSVASRQSRPGALVDRRRRRLHLSQSEHRLGVFRRRRLTYNFKNPYLQYQNGIDAHLDWGVSHFVSKQMHLGLVGYYYQQLTGDSGSGATPRPISSRVSSASVRRSASSFRSATCRAISI